MRALTSPLNPFFAPLPSSRLLRAPPSLFRDRNQCFNNGLSCRRSSQWWRLLRAWGIGAGQQQQGGSTVVEE